MTPIDLDPQREPAALVDAIWEARRQDRKDLAGDVAELLAHQDPTVRSEAVSLLGAKWEQSWYLPQFSDLLANDPDTGVRSRAALAIGSLSTAFTRARDLQQLKEIVLDQQDDEDVRSAAYEALLRLQGRGREAPLARLPDDLSWVRQL